MKVSIEQFDYYKRHPEIFVEEFLGVPLTTSQKILLRVMRMSKEYQDIVRVTRCKDCKHWHKEMSNDGKVEYFNYSYCDKEQPGNGNDYYCPYGERNSDV